MKERCHKFLLTYKNAIIKRVLALLVVLLVIAYSYVLKVVEYRFVDMDNLQLGNSYLQQSSKRLSMALITDLHSCYYGNNQQILVEKLQTKQPDVILLGGDIYDDQLPFDNADKLLAQLADIAPTFYVDGNHENWLSRADYDDVMRRIRQHRVHILHGKQAHIPDSNVYVYGVSDPDGGAFERDLQNVAKQLNPNNVNILLTHRPERIDEYRRYAFDVVLAGHAHGGQWRVPFLLNGVYAPNQGFLPKYAGGLYEFDRQKLIVSRGLARESTRVPRLFNRPELVFIELIARH